MKKIIFYIISLFLFFNITSCDTADKKADAKTLSNKQIRQMKTQYTQLFRVSYYENYKKISILNPWEKGKIYHTYYLVSDSSFLQQNTDSTSYIVNNIQRAACLSADQIAAFDLLGISDKIAAVSQKKYIYNPHIQKAIENKKIVELGDYQTFNIEACLAANLDAVFNTGWAQAQKTFQSLNRNNLPVIYYLAWQEQNPLGRAEWIKFIAAFFNKEKEAKQYFAKIEREYTSLKEDLSKKISKKVSVFNGNMMSGTWYVAGSKSYLAQLLEDAQTNYLFSDNNKTGSIPLSFESVYLKAKDADFWLPSVSVINNGEVLDARYKDFKAYQKRHLYIYNHRINKMGGNDYWESGSVHPEKILNDLANIFYPQLFDKDSLFYYQQIKY